MSKCEEFGYLKTINNNNNDENNHKSTKTQKRIHIVHDDSGNLFLETFISIPVKLIILELIHNVMQPSYHISADPKMNF